MEKYDKSNISIPLWELSTCYLLKDVLKRVLIIENTPTKDEALVSDRQFCVQSSNDYFLELKYGASLVEFQGELVWIMTC